MKPRTLTESEVTFTLDIEPEDTHPRDHFSEPETIQWVTDQLDAGNDWAWFTARVTATWQGYTGIDYLGGCSYRSRDDFEQDAYFQDMKSEALAALNDEVKRHVESLRPLL